MERDKEIARFFDCCEPAGQRKMNSKVSARARRELIKGVQEGAVLDGSTVLEVGCGPGDLTRELVRLGANRALGVDLAEKTLEHARAETERQGLGDLIEFRVANGAVEALGPHDVVVLDKVVCCYPDWRQLVTNTVRSASKRYGFVIPRSDGFSGVVARAFIGLMRLILRLRKCGFQPFVHDYSLIHRHLISEGMTRTRLYKGPIWMTAVYSRA